MKLSLLFLTLLISMSGPAWCASPITDDFSKYPGDAGRGGWITKWDYKSSAGCTIEASTSTTSPLSGGADYLVVTGTKTAPMEGGSINRAFDSGSGGVSSESPYTISFDFRPDLPLHGHDSYNFYSATSIGSTTSTSDIWQIRGLARGWYVDSGDGTGGVVASAGPVMPLVVGTIYHFTVKVDPSTKTWKVTINDGTTPYASKPINFRTVGDTTSDRTYLHFGVSFGEDVADTLTFSLDSLSISVVSDSGSDTKPAP